MIAQERIETNQLLMEMVGLDLTVKSLRDDVQAQKYYNIIVNHIDNQLQSAIDWIDSSEAKEFFFNDAYHQAEIWDSLEDDWDNILSGKYETIDDLLEEVYDYGKIRGYSDMAETLRYTPTDRLAFAFARNYNYGLIQNLDNDLRASIKDRMTRAAIEGENPYSLAPHIYKLGIQQLPGSTFTPYQRAVLIARTETSRIQNTGILQSYVNEGYTQVKLLTAEDDNVCTLCLRYAFEFNKGEKVTFENRGPELVHNIRDLIKGGEYPPFHPLCRCTYLSVWETKTTPPENPYTVDLTNNKFHDFSEEPLTLNTGEGDYSKENIMKHLSNAVDTKDVEAVADIIINFRKKAIKEDVECIGTFNSKMKEISQFVRSDQMKNVGLPAGDLEQAGEKGFGVIIHSHTSGIPFPSTRDLKLNGLEYKVKYGIQVTENGGFTIIRHDSNINVNEKVFKKYESTSRKILDEWDNATQQYKEELKANNELDFRIPSKIKIFKNKYMADSFDKNAKRLNNVVSGEGFQIIYKNP